MKLYLFVGKVRELRRILAGNKSRLGKLLEASNAVR